MAPINDHASISNALVTPEQILMLKRHDENNYPGTADALRYASAELTQSAGILLRLSQEVVVQAVVLMQRYVIISAADLDSTRTTAKDASAASLYLAAKLSFTPVSPRSLLTVYAYLTSASSPLALFNPSPPAKTGQLDPTLHHLSEGTYEIQRNELYLSESKILKALGFDTHVSSPHPLALTYLSVLGLHSNADLTLRVIAHLNAALLSPQLLYLTHQPNALAVAAIYLSAKEVEVKLVDGNWWEVFDVDREDLGFLVVSMQGIPEYARTIRDEWDGRKLPLD